MAVGDKRHYVVDTVMPRHLLQTAARAGVGASVLETIFDDI
jgi:serine/threonine-protein kinase HipA